jgi:glyceraldehyde 3-phosphate dehydrogenase
VGVRIGVNGLGRIGRALLRIARQRPDLGVEVVAANDAADGRVLARLLRHDTVHAGPSFEVEGENGWLRLGGATIPVSHATSPAEIDWSAAGVEMVVEATGRFRARDLASGHLRGTVRRVVVSATLPDADANFCLGINEETFDPARHVVVSNTSCTTNCLAVTLAPLVWSFGVERALMNTVHCVTNSQNLVDNAHPDPRRARAAIANIIPTTSDAIPSIGWVMPELAGRVEGMATRVPVVAGALVDLAVALGRDAERGELEAAYRAAESGRLAGILGTTDEELVSSDFVGDPRSGVVDLPLLLHVGQRLWRVISWYDNEWGYSNRLAELLARLAAAGG